MKCKVAFVQKIALRCMSDHVLDGGAVVTVWECARLVMCVLVTWAPICAEKH